MVQRNINLKIKNKNKIVQIKIIKILDSGFMWIIRRKLNLGNV